MTSECPMHNSRGVGAVEAVPIVDVDPYSDAFFENPYPWYEEMLNAGPVFRIEQWNLYGLARYDDVRWALSNPEIFASSAGVGVCNYAKEAPARPPIGVLEDDGTEHSRLRAIYNRLLSRRTVSQLREHFAEVAEQIVDSALSEGTLDAVQGLSMAYPLAVFPDALGLKKEGREHLLPFADMAFNTHGPDNVLRRESLKNMQQHLPFQIESCKRENLAEESIGATVYSYVDQGLISVDEAAMLMSPLFTAGMDTTVNTLSAALYCLASNPDQWRILREDPSLAKNAFEEAVRYETPIQSFCRTTTRQVEIGGTPVEAGEKVMMVFAAANRDPRRWERPDAYDVTRDVSGHLGFGAGVHMCAGQMVAKLEGELLLAELARRVESIEISGPVTRRYNNVLRGLESVPITIKAK